MAQMIGAWNARLWLHYKSKKPIGGMPPAFSGEFVTDKDEVYIKGILLLAGIKLELSSEAIKIANRSSSFALSTIGRPLASIIDIPHCGNDEIEGAALKTIITNIEDGPDSTWFVYETPMLPWDALKGKAA